MPLMVTSIGWFLCCPSWSSTWCHWGQSLPWLLSYNACQMEGVLIPLGASSGDASSCWPLYNGLPYGHEECPDLSCSSCRCGQSRPHQGGGPEMHLRVRRILQEHVLEQRCIPDPPGVELSPEDPDASIVVGAVSLSIAVTSTEGNLEMSILWSSSPRPEKLLLKVVALSIINEDVVVASEPRSIFWSAFESEDHCPHPSGDNSSVPHPEGMVYICHIKKDMSWWGVSLSEQCSHAHTVCPLSTLHSLPLYQLLILIEEKKFQQKVT